ncbi:MAG TPA: plastocyanin/azurin family copper-binding protein [Solirubrobacteraceae bacterium]|nr:plastocyanin/azurin family copper-binding protein [Solirubrobacteraceae bacterium]
MTLRKPLLVLVAVLLGGALGVMPALAGTESAPTVEAVNIGGGIYGEEHRWSPSSASIAPGASITFANNTTVAHGIEWIGGPGAPACEPSVPVGKGIAASGTEWKGDCTFAAAGTYSFYCTVHGPAMRGTIVVGGGGTTTTVTSTGTSTPTGGGATSTGAATPPAAGAPSGASSVPGAGGTQALFSALHLGGSPHGPVVYGSLTVSPASAGGTLTVQVLAARAQLASAHAPVVIARLVRRSLRPGPLSFSARVSARGRSALHRRGRLRVTVRIAIVPAQGTPAVTSRALTLRR